MRQRIISPTATSVRATTLVTAATLVTVFALVALLALFGVAGSAGALGGARHESPGNAGRRAPAAHFPVSVRSDGRTVTIDKAPRRILCLSPSATQMLYTIGAWKQVAGVDRYSAWPKKAPRTSFTGGETNAADYLSLHPDLVIFSYVSGQVTTELQALHIPALVLPPATTIAGVDRQIRELGEVTGHVAGAKAEVVSLDRDLRRTVASAHTKGRKATYYFEITPTYYSATSKTFIGAVFARFSMVDIADPAGRAGTTYPQLSAEYIVKADPDYVFLADTVCCSIDPQNFARRPGFSTLDAVHAHHVVGLNDSVASQWGPHSLEALAAAIAHALGAPAQRP